MALEMLQNSDSDVFVAGDLSEVESDSDLSWVNENTLMQRLAEELTAEFMEGKRAAWQPVKLVLFKMWMGSLLVITLPKNTGLNICNNYSSLHVIVCILISTLLNLLKCTCWYYFVFENIYNRINALIPQFGVYHKGLYSLEFKWSKWLLTAIVLTDQLHHYPSVKVSVCFNQSVCRIVIQHLKHTPLFLLLALEVVVAFDNFCNFPASSLTSPWN